MFSRHDSNFSNEIPSTRWSLICSICIYSRRYYLCVASRCRLFSVGRHIVITIKCSRTHTSSCRTRIHANITTQFWLRLSSHIQISCSPCGYLSSTDYYYYLSSIVLACGTSLCGYVVCICHNHFLALISVLQVFGNWWPMPSCSNDNRTKLFASNMFEFAVINVCRFAECCLFSNEKNTNDTAIKRHWHHRNYFNSKFENRCSAMNTIQWERRMKKKNKSAQNHERQMPKRYECRSGHRPFQTIHRTRYGKRKLFGRMLYCVCISLRRVHGFGSVRFIWNSVCSASKHRVKNCTAGQMVESR